MFQFLGSTPLWLIAGLALIGIILLTHGNRRSNVRIRSAGLLTVSLAVLLLAGRFLIDTDAERASRHTEQIVEACNQKDWTKLADLLDPRTSVSLAGQGKDSVGGQAIAQAAHAAADAGGLKSVQILNSRVEQTPGLIAVTFSAAAVADENLDRPALVGFEFDYRQDGKKWFLSDIKLLSAGNESFQ